MGWVADAFREQDLIPELWNRIRDSISQAVIEFNERQNESKHKVERRDCLANGKNCVRVQKADGSYVEVYLDEKVTSIMLFTPNTMPADRLICKFRLCKATGTLELVIDNETASTEDCCREALASFLGLRHR